MHQGLQSPEQRCASPQGLSTEAFFAEHAAGVTATEGQKEPTLTGVHKLLGAVIIASVLEIAPGRSLPQPCLTTAKREGGQGFIHSLTTWE